MKILLWISVLSMLACSAKKNVVENTALQKQVSQQIEFGSGGGFTGMWDNYILKQNGNLFKYSGEGENKLLKTLDPKQTDLLFKKVNELQLDQMEFNRPGNMSYYLGLKKGDGPTKKVLWSFGESEAPDRIIAVYDELVKVATR